MAVTVYRGIAIYYEGQEEMYFCHIYGTFYERSTLAALIVVIDEILGVEPPEPPPEEQIITVVLNPPLDGATLELRDRSYSGDTLVRTQLSVDGVSYFERGSLPDFYYYVVRFPPQTIGGVAYQEAETSLWMFQVAPREYMLLLQLAEELVETYRDVDIYWRPTINAYWAQVVPDYVAVAATLVEIRVLIDEALEFLYPPEEPNDGLFAQIVAALQAWVLENMPEWVLEWGQNLYTTINNVVENITNVYNDLREYVTNVYNNVYETIENTYNTFREYVTNVYNYITEEITNIYNNTYNYFTEVIGASVEWVEERLVNIKNYIDSRPAIWDPTGFLADPPTYISGMFSLLGLAKETEMVESFLAGLEEGLTEETEV